MIFNPLSDEAIIRRYTVNRRWTNTSLIRRRSFDGHIISMKQSGTHWLKNILSAIMIDIYDLPTMKHIQDDSIIGHPKSPPLYDNIPKIVHSHSYPHGLTLRMPFLHFPKYVILVRDMKEGLVSHYERFSEYYGNVDFKSFLHGDVTQKQFRSDIYSRIRFMNEWGSVIDRNPGKLHILTYEDLRRDPLENLKNLCQFFGIDGATDEIISSAIEKNTKGKMAEMATNPLVETTIVRTGGKKAGDYFDLDNTAFFNTICRNYLTHDFGYGYPTKN